MGKPGKKANKVKGEADLQTAFERAAGLMQRGDFAGAAAQFGACHDGAAAAAAEVVNSGAAEAGATGAEGVLYQCLLHRGACLTVMPARSDHVAALEAYEKCVALATAGAGGADLKEPLGLVADLKIEKLEDFEGALTTVEQMLALCGSGGNVDEAEALVHKGNALVGLGRAQEALAVIARALALAKKAQDVRIEAYASIALVKARLAEGNAAKAAPHAERAFELAKEDGDYGRVAESLEILASVKAAAGETGKAAELLDDAIGIGGENPMRPPPVDVYLARAALAEDGAALPFLGKAREAAEASERPALLARVLFATAEAHAAAGASAKAAAALEDARKAGAAEGELTAAFEKLGLPAGEQ